MMAVRVPEIVTVTWRVLEERGRPDLDDVLRRIGELDRIWGSAPETPSYFGGRSVSLAGLFRRSGYVVNPDFQHVRVHRLQGVLEDGPLHIQPSVGVPLGGG